ncbi:hypothetical protein FJR11_00875 [Anabaena sp. UHCC 0187]|uniref:hypothetical protein n=1 Tax=Anabaena sp. UHCC 0187 TaxID=2590018 RepID=UPI00144612E1|nr:hypothetical protein [Anabaena sp. UHCC 0187]MTJ11172.1 hypothetical protein [Anabaena sp. UHCC 0187]
MNNKLFTSISIKEQENTSGGAGIPDISGILDISGIPDITGIPPSLISPLGAIYSTTVVDLLTNILPIFGYRGQIPSSISF